MAEGRRGRRGAGRQSARVWRPCAVGQERHGVENWREVAYVFAARPRITSLYASQCIRLGSRASGCYARAAASRHFFVARAPVFEFAKPPCSRLAAWSPVKRPTMRLQEVVRGRDGAASAACGRLTIRR